MILRSTCALLCSIVFAASADVARAVDVVAVCPERFRETLQPWIDHRRQDGFEVCIIDTSDTSRSLAADIAKAADDKTRYVLLVGDAPVIGTRCDRSRQVPTAYSRTQVTAKWGSPPTLSSDMPLGDLDNDGVPDAVVGRLPVQRPSDLKALIERIISYETSEDFGPWRGNVQLVGGVGGFGMVADAAIESVTRNIVTSVLPVETRTHVCYASPGHMFCPQADSFTDAVVNQYQQGARFWVYAGHGAVTALDNVPPTADGTPVLDRSSVTKLDRPASSAPIAVMLACYTGAMDAGENSLAEQMLLTQGGPIAVFAGSRVTMPYGNTTAAVGLINAVYEEKLPRLGDAWLSTLLQMHNDDEANRPTSRVMIDALATIISPSGTKLVDERREHMKLYNLLGDPTLRMHQPETVEIGVASGVNAGEAFELIVKCAIDGQCTISLDRPLGAVVGADPNNTTVAAKTIALPANKQAVYEIAAPDDVVGPIVIRAIVSGRKSWATGAARTMLRRAD
jgi:hypothetical protein